MISYGFAAQKTEAGPVPGLVENVKSSAQNVNLPPNWMILGSYVLMTCPKVLLDILVSGSLNSAWLKMLKNSARTWKATRSVILVALASARSKFARSGPRRMFLPEPYLPVMTDELGEEKLVPEKYWLPGVPGVGL